MRGMDTSRKILCDPCQFEGKYLDATTVCKQCREFYCDECKRLHFKFQLSRDHVLASINVLSSTGSKTSPKLKREIPSVSSKPHPHAHSKGNDANRHNEHKSSTSRLKEYSALNGKDNQQMGVLHEKLKEKRFHKISSSEREEIKRNTAYLHEKIDSLKH